MPILTAIVWECYYYLYVKAVDLSLIVFLRHGQALNNVQKILAGRTPGYELTQKGVEQARAAARMLRPLGISHIYCSPVERARQTASIVAGEVSADVTPDDRLLELDMGSFTGMRYDDIELRYGNVFEKFYHGSPDIEENGIESFADVRQRVADMADHIVRSHPEENTLLVTHMDPVKAMLANVTGLDPHSLYRLIIANASLNIFAQHQGEIYLMGLNVVDTARFNDVW